MKEASPSQSRHRASRKGRDFGASWDWNDEVNEGIFGSSWTCLVSLSGTSSRMFNQSPAHTAELGSNMFPDSGLAGTGFVSPDDLPPSDEEDDEEGQLVSVLFGSFWLTCM